MVEDNKDMVGDYNEDMGGDSGDMSGEDNRDGMERADEKKFDTECFDDTKEQHYKLVVKIHMYSKFYRINITSIENICPSITFLLSVSHTAISNDFTS